VGWFYFQEGAAPRSAATLDSAAGQRYAPVFRGLLARGVYVAPSAYEVFFLSSAHTPAHVEKFASALAAALDEAAKGKSP
jgi:glutamate-1-semialdehyde 2,1-aminomutase